MLLDVTVLLVPTCLVLNVPVPFRVTISPVIIPVKVPVTTAAVVPSYIFEVTRGLLIVIDRAVITRFDPFERLVKVYV